MSKKNVLVTGGSGYFGSILIDKLIRKDYNVFSIDINRPSDFSNFNFSNIDITLKKEGRPTGALFYSNPAITTGLIGRFDLPAPTLTVLLARAPEPLSFQ